jgi:AraC-like DNA-binding protein
MAEGSIAAGFARALIGLAIRQGADRAALCRRAGIAPDVLEDQDNRIPFAGYVALMRAAKEATGDPALALHFGEAFEIDELSIVGLIGGACQTVAEAIAAMNRYERLIVDVGGRSPRLTLSREGGQVWLVDTRKNPNEFPELTESSFARMASTMQRWPGTAPLLRAAHFTHQAPSYRSEYDRIFRVPLQFEAERNALLLGGDTWLAAKPPMPSRYLFGVLSQRAEALLENLERDTTMRGRVESLLLPILHTGEASMAVVAARLGVSRQTLARKLKAEGMTFEKLLDGLRHRLALAYLGEKRVSVNETAYLLGFSDPASFSHAFKRWTGTSPRQARR